MKFWNWNSRLCHEEQCRVAGTFFMIPGWSEEFNRIFGFRTETQPGMLDLLTRAWNSAKDSLLGSIIQNPASISPG